MAPVPEPPMALSHRRPNWWSPAECEPWTRSDDDPPNANPYSPSILQIQGRKTTLSNRNEPHWCLHQHPRLAQIIYSVGGFGLRGGGFSYRIRRENKTSDAIVLLAVHRWIHILTSGEGESALQASNDFLVVSNSWRR
jgi:hypothetical protein